MKYADAPGTARSAAETSPPVDDSATARVSFRAFKRTPIFSPSGNRSFIARSFRGKRDS
jgi:hypothetical protein